MKLAKRAMLNRRKAQLERDRRLLEYLRSLTVPNQGSLPIRRTA